MERQLSEGTIEGGIKKRKGHSHVHSLRNFQSVLRIQTVIPRIILNLLSASGTQTLLASSTQTAITHQH